MAPPPPPNSFFADQIAQDAFDANLNKTVFLIALAFAVLIQVCVLVYLAWLVVRRCCFGRSRGDDVPDEGNESEDVQDGGEGERESVKEDLEVPSLPRELVLPGLLTEDTPPPLPPSRHHRSPSLRESIFGLSEPQPDDSAKPASSSSWFNLRWSWEVPVVQIDLERAASPVTPSPATSPVISGSASTTSGSDFTTPDSLASPAISLQVATTASAPSPASPTSAPFSVATPTQILCSELKQARLQVPRIVISPPSPLSPSSSSPSSASASPASPACLSSPSSSSSVTSGATIDFEMDVDSALGIDTPNHDEDQEGEREQEYEEQIQTRIDPTYLYVPPTSCYPPRELVESPSGRGFDVSFFSSPGSSASTSSMGLSGSSPDEATPCEETPTKTKTRAKTKSKIAKRKSPGAYENTTTLCVDENATQPTKTKEKQTLSARVFGALADLSNFTGLTSPSPTTSLGVQAKPAAASPSTTSTPSLELPTTPNESFFSRCEEALYDIESSGHGGVW
ncbi:hypothetical protein BC629DRAFT_1490328 [Irpex lacteus]|nr:hypothetical protein BC629DRAFT_1490328 [Irpex lacteus]